MAYVSKKEVMASLDAANIDYDPESNRTDLIELLPDEPEMNEPTVKMRLLRDYWPREGVRMFRNQEIYMTMDQAMDAMESRLAERVK